MDKYIVVKNWITDYPNPLILKLGQNAKVDNSITENNPNWQGWTWCISDKNAGWTPVQILNITESVSKQYSDALVLEDYSAQELNIEIGDTVLGERKLNGWLWCTKDNSNFGWVPLENIEIICE